MRSRPLPRVVCSTTYPDGHTIHDDRPGHTIAGLLYLRDPFQREGRCSPLVVRVMMRQYPAVIERSELELEASS